VPRAGLAERHQAAELPRAGEQDVQRQRRSFLDVEFLAGAGGDDAPRDVDAEDLDPPPRPQRHRKIEGRLRGIAFPDHRIGPGDARDETQHRDIAKDILIERGVQAQGDAALAAGQVADILATGGDGHRCGNPRHRARPAHGFRPTVIRMISGSCTVRESLDNDSARLVASTAAAAPPAADQNHQVFHQGRGAGTGSAGGAGTGTAGGGRSTGDTGPATGAATAAVVQAAVRVIVRGQEYFVRIAAFIAFVVEGPHDEVIGFILVESSNGA
jgi:hypothetical protein